MELNYNVRIEEIMPKSKQTKTKMLDFLNSFIESGNEAAEVTWEGTYKSASICYSCMKTSIQKNNISCDVVRRGDHVYLIRKKNEEE